MAGPDDSSGSGPIMILHPSDPNGFRGGVPSDETFEGPGPAVAVPPAAPLVTRPPAPSGTAAGWQTFAAAVGLSRSMGLLEAEEGEASDAASEDLLEGSARDRELDEQSLEELLDEMDIVEACRSGDTALQRRLCRPDALCTLVAYVTSEVPSKSSEECRRRRPYIATDILTIECVLEALLEPPVVGEVGAFEQLWAFLESDAQSTSAPVLAGYFCAVASALFLRSPRQVAARLQRDGAGTALVAGLVRWLSLRCCAELFATLLLPSGTHEAVFAVEAVVGPLLRCVCGDNEPRPDAAAREHASYLLEALVARAAGGDLPAAPSLVVLDELAAPAPAAALVSEVLAATACGGEGNASSAAAAGLLAATVAHLHGLAPHPGLPVGPVELRGSLGCHAPWQGDERDAPSSRRGGDPMVAAQLDSSAAALIEELCSRLGDLCGRLPQPGPAEVAVEATRHLEEAVQVLLRLQALDHAEDRNAPEEGVGLAARLLQLGESCPELQAALDRRGFTAATASPTVARFERPDELVLTLSRAASSTLGISFEVSDVGSDLLITKLKEGLFLEWNRANPERAVKVGDSIVDVNGVGVGAEGGALILHQTLCKEPHLEVKVRRASAFEEPPWPLYANGGVVQVPELLQDLRESVQRGRSALSAPDAAHAAGGSVGAAGAAGGAAAVEVLRLLCLLVRTGRVVVFQAFIRERVLPRCLEALLCCRWSSVLHCALYAVVSEAISNEEHGAEQAVALLGEATLWRHAVLELRDAAEVQEAIAHGANARLLQHKAAGYLAIIRRLCQDLCRLSARCPEVACASERLDGWAEVVRAEVEFWERLHEEPLGGPLPVAAPAAGFDCLAVARAALKDSTEDATLSEEDLRDLDEEIEETHVLQLASARRRRRGEGSPIGGDDDEGDAAWGHPEEATSPDRDRGGGRPAAPTPPGSPPPLEGLGRGEEAIDG